MSLPAGTKFQYNDREQKWEAVRKEVSGPLEKFAKATAKLVGTTNFIKTIGLGCSLFSWSKLGVPPSNAPRSPWESAANVLGAVGTVTCIVEGLPTLVQLPGKIVDWTRASEAKRPEAASLVTESVLKVISKVVTDFPLGLAKLKGLPLTEMQTTALKVVHYVAAIPLGVMSYSKIVKELGEGNVEKYPLAIYKDMRLAKFVSGINKIILLSMDIFLFLVAVFAVTFSPVVSMAFVVAYVSTLIAHHYLNCDFEEKRDAFQLENANRLLAAGQLPAPNMVRA